MLCTVLYAGNLQMMPRSSVLRDLTGNTMPSSRSQTCTLTSALELGEFGEDELQCVLDPLVRVLLDPVAPRLHIASRKAEEQRAATRFLLQRLVRALAEQRQLQLTHRAFHSEQQPIIGMPRIIDSVLVHDDSPDQSTELDQRMPVAAVARQPGHLDREHSPDAAFADRRKQALEARPIDAAARATQIIVDDLYRCPTELPGTIGEPILPAPALVIVHELIGRRLTDINACAAREMVSRDRGHRRSPRLPVLSRSRAAALSPASPARSSLRAPARREARPRRTGSAGDSRIGASSPSFSILESDWRKPRSAAISARSDRRISRENCGSAHNLQCAAASCIIHAGMQALDPSGCGMTTSSTPR